MNESKKGLEIIDPFKLEYRKLTAARSDDYYKKFYEEMFQAITCDLCFKGLKPTI